MKTIHFNLSKSYDVLIGSGLIEQIHFLINPICSGKTIAIVTDDIVDELYGNSLFNQLKNNNYSVAKFVFENGEQSKNIDTLSKILDFLVENELKRNDYIIALGGGVVGDISGLSASMYMRGINYIQIPTTLLAMIDASIGGKTAIDLNAGKNLAGTFWQPSMVVCDTEIIKKLPLKIFSQGMAEVVKYDVIDNLGILESVFHGEVKNNLDSIIYKCIKSKQRVVEKDEYETKGLRKILNVGHTFAHGLEKISNYKISHGFAVGTGLVWEAGISHKLKLCPKETFELIKKAVRKCELLIDFEYNYKDLVEEMKKDKKNDDSLISFILPLQIGNCVEKKLKDTEVISILESVRKLI